MSKPNSSRALPLVGLTPYSSSGITIRVWRRKPGIFAVVVATRQPDKRGISPGIFRLGRRRPCVDQLRERTAVRIMGIAESRNRNQITSPFAVRNLSTPRRPSLPIGAGLRSVHSRHLWYPPAARCYRKPCSKPTVARNLGKFLNHSADTLRPGSSHVKLTGATGPSTSIHGHISMPGVLLQTPTSSSQL